MTTETQKLVDRARLTRDELSNAPISQDTIYADIVEAQLAKALYAAGDWLDEKVAWSGSDLLKELRDAGIERP